MRCDSERSEESLPCLLDAVSLTQGKIPRFGRNGIPCFLGAACGMTDCFENRCAEGTLECGGLTPPLEYRKTLNHAAHWHRP